MQGSGWCAARPGTGAPRPAPASHASPAAGARSSPRRPGPRNRRPAGRIAPCPALPPPHRLRARLCTTSRPCPSWSGCWGATRAAWTWVAAGEASSGRCCGSRLRGSTSPSSRSRGCMRGCRRSSGRGRVSRSIPWPSASRRAGPRARGAGGLLPPRRVLLHGGAVNRPRHGPGGPRAGQAVTCGERPRKPRARAAPNRPSRPRGGSGMIVAFTDTVWPSPARLRPPMPG